MIIQHFINYYVCAQKEENTHTASHITIDTPIKLSYILYIYNLYLKTEHKQYYIESSIGLNNEILFNSIERI